MIFEISTAFSEERGLQLIIESVGADSPAFRSGAREGDVIVAVDDWLITPMDRPQVNINHMSIAGIEVSLNGQKAYILHYIIR